MQCIDAFYVQDSEEYRDAALKSLAADPGIHQLVPYFTQFIFDTVRHHVRNLPTLKRAMRMVAALLESEHIHLELYVRHNAPLSPCYGVLARNVLMNLIPLGTASPVDVIHSDVHSGSVAVQDSR